jgi:hypothetical protein
MAAARNLHLFFSLSALKACYWTAEFDYIYKLCMKYCLHVNSYKRVYPARYEI